MADIFTHSQEEYDQLVELFGDQRWRHEIRRPDDSYAIVVWSIDDLKSDSRFVDLTDDQLRIVMHDLENSIENAAVRGVWDCLYAMDLSDEIADALCNGRECKDCTRNCDEHYCDSCGLAHKNFEPGQIEGASV
jgi:hypothetical protein